MGIALRIGILVAVGAFAMAGCGVNGPLEPPGGVTVDKGQTAPTKPAAHSPFILDGILQ